VSDGSGCGTKAHSTAVIRRGSAQELLTRVTKGGSARTDSMKKISMKAAPKAVQCVRPPIRRVRTWNDVPKAPAAAALGHVLR
jgi:hypothetical protein